MNANDVLLLGIGIQSPWQLVGQRLDTDKTPHELHLQVKTERGSKFPCPQCGQECAAHGSDRSQVVHDVGCASRSRAVHNRATGPQRPAGTLSAHSGGGSSLPPIIVESGIPPRAHRVTSRFVLPSLTLIIVSPRCLE